MKSESVVIVFLAATGLWGALGDWQRTESPASGFYLVSALLLAGCLIAFPRAKKAAMVLAAAGFLSQVIGGILQ